MQSKAERRRDAVKQDKQRCVERAVQQRPVEEQRRLFEKARRLQEEKAQQRHQAKANQLH